MIGPATLALALLLAQEGAVSPSPPPVPQAPTLSPAAAEALDLRMRVAMARLQLPGASAAVAVNGRIAWTGAYGTADLENDVPVTPSTMFRFASISKPITAVAVLQLAAQQRLGLDEDVRRYCPEFPEKEWPMTPRHLLAHQAGIRDYDKGEWGSTIHYPDVRSALVAFSRDPLEFEPGTRFLYSTYGFSVLGCAVEGASGLEFLEYLRQHVFAPAGMMATRDDDVLALIPGRARGYARRGDDSLRNSILADTSNKVPGGGLIGTAADAARFGAALLDGRLLPAPWRERMMTEQSTRRGTRTGSGLGLFVARVRGMTEAWHVAGQPQVSGILYVQPSRRIAVAILANLEGQGAELRTVARGMADVVKTTAR